MARPKGTTLEFCKKGHSLTDDNVYVGKVNRRCKECKKAWERDYWRKNHKRRAKVGT